jgi:hypothetical protein
MARTVRKSRVKEVPLSEVKDDLSRYLREAETQEIVIVNVVNADTRAIWSQRRHGDITEPHDLLDEPARAVVRADQMPCLVVHQVHRR